jgi:hypothetical protein
LIAALVLGSGSLLAACGERPDVSTPAAAPGDHPNARAPITAHCRATRPIAPADRTGIPRRGARHHRRQSPRATLHPEAGHVFDHYGCGPRAEEPKQASIEAARTARAPGKADHESASAKPARRTTVKRSVPDDAIPLDGPAAQTTTMPAAAGPRASPQPGDADADQASRR